MFGANKSSGRPKEIIVVDDNPADLDLTLAGFQAEGDQFRITTFVDGESAIAYLQRGKDCAQWPDLIILDLNLPRMSGYEVLITLKADVRLRRIPTVMFSGSADEGDVARAYDGQAAAYIVKPSTLDEYISAVLGIRNLWLTQAAAPPHPNHREFGSRCIGH